VKFVVGDPASWMNGSPIVPSIPEHCPDYVQVDGGEGGTGAAPAPLADYVGLPITQALPYVTALRYEHGLKGGYG
jgi:glutamate synthase domain-containing protein 2